MRRATPESTLPTSLLLLLILAVPALGESTGWKVIDSSARTRRLEPWRAPRAATGRRPTPGETLLAEGRTSHEPFPEWSRAAARRQAAAPGLPAGRAVTLDDGLAGSPLGAKVLGRFEGLDRLESGQGGHIFYPPDAIVAAGTDSVLQAANESVRLYTRQGEVVATSSLNDLFSTSYPPGLFDPKLYHDPGSDRFVVVAVQRRDHPRKSFIYLAVSRTASPHAFGAEDWCTYRIRGKRRGSWADFPGVGADGRRLVVTVNNFRFNDRGFRTVFVYALDQATLLDNSSSCPSPRLSVLQAHSDAGGWPAFTLQPGRHHGPVGDPERSFYLLSARYAVQSDDYVVWRIHDGEGGGVRLSVANVQSGAAYAFPPDAEQPDELPFEVGGPKVIQTIYRQGLLWGVHSTGCTFGGARNRSCVRVVALRPSSEGAILELADTFGRAEDYFFRPALALTSRGDAIAVFHRSSATEPVGTAYATLRPGAERFSHLRALARGSCALRNRAEDAEVNRVGDYPGAQMDPNDPAAFWITGEYADVVTGLGCDWKTRIARVRR